MLPLVLAAATLASAVAFRPFVPDGTLRSTSLQPPFHAGAVHGEGIAYDYARNARAWILSEWPRRGGSLDRFTPLPLGEPRCTDVHAAGNAKAPRGIVWSTPRGVILSLVPDGSADARTITAEWRRLVRLGACR